MKKLLIPIAVIACASIAVLCTACQQENTESEAIKISPSAKTE